MSDDSDYGTRWAYAVLGVSPGANPATVRRAFRRLALQHHPSRNLGDRGAAMRFRHISNAYRTLTRSGSSGSRTITTTDRARQLA